MENLQPYSKSLLFCRTWGCLWMMRVTWSGSEVCPGPARRRRLLVFSLVRIMETLQTLKDTPWNQFHHYTLFSDCDIVGKVNGVCFTYSKEGRPSGEAFIELKTAEDFKNALAKDRKYMGHRYIEGKIAEILKWWAFSLCCPCWWSQHCLACISFRQIHMSSKILFTASYFYTFRFSLFDFSFWCSV